MHFKAVVIGLGEIGRPLYECMRSAFFAEVFGFDIKNGSEMPEDKNPKFSEMHVCIPYSKDFVKIVKAYKKKFDSPCVIIHSTVPVGTTSKIPDAVHSPILGRHVNMAHDIMTFTKWIGGNSRVAKNVSHTMNRVGIATRIVPTPEETELMKLMCLAKYGVSLSFALYQKEVSKKFNIPYRRVLEWDRNYNNNVNPNTLTRPLITPNGHIGGHCVIPGAKILNKQFKNPHLEEIMRHAKR